MHICSFRIHHYISEKCILLNTRPEPDSRKFLKKTRLELNSYFVNSFKQISSDDLDSGIDIVSQLEEKLAHTSVQLDELVQKINHEELDTNMVNNHYIYYIYIFQFVCAIKC